MQNKLSLTVIFCHFICIICDQNKEQPNREKRFSKFVVGGSNNGEDEDVTAEKRLSSFMRIGKSNPEEKRLSSFVRIGKLHPEDKRLSSFVRIGKSQLEDELHSSWPYDEKRMRSFVRIGKSMIPNDDLSKRLSSFVRIGKNYPEENKRYSSFVRIGKDLTNALAKRSRTSSFVRIGKSYDELDSDVLPAYELVEKRPASSFVRIGKANTDPQKRYSSFVRIGKQSDKLGSEYVKIDNADDAAPNDETDESYKLIKDVNSLQGPEEDQRLKRRKRSPELDQPSKRGFIRIGKIPSSSFMRIGRNRLMNSLLLRKYVREGRRGHSSFIRIGKRADLPVDSDMHDDGLMFLLQKQDV
ncbi:FMRF-amide neuropeptides-like [Mytilus californianus]|uniref:FMRF-amide neuropeptides-like n=1 Tax=Mytilus californianus TaxID=6549 RepID=UPI0022472C98|nr:FMRF-amide neuropeptides-like [Mytilus californianus]